MGELDTDAVIHHFSHQHPLKLLNLQLQTVSTVTCAGCKRDASASGWVYNCSTCKYYLHKPCSNLPQNLSHSADKEHTLILLPSPAYRDGAYICNGCGGRGTGFGYHCQECELNIHPVCAFMPSSIEHGSHFHPLHLCFSPPRNKKGFKCDVCEGAGSYHWLYRCDSCNFNAHMRCAKIKTQSKTSPIIQQSQQPQLVKSTSAPSQIQKLSSNCSSCAQTGHHFSPPPIQQYQQQLHQHIGIPYIQTAYPILENGYSNGSQSSRGQPSVVPQQHPQQGKRNNTVRVVGSLIEGLTEGMAQQVGQAVLQSILEG